MLRWSDVSCCREFWRWAVRLLREGATGRVRARGLGGSRQWWQWRWIRWARWGAVPAELCWRWGADSRTIISTKLPILFLYKLCASRSSFVRLVPMYALFFLGTCQFLHGLTDSGRLVRGAIQNIFLWAARAKFSGIEVHISSAPKFSGMRFTSRIYCVLGRRHPRCVE